MTTRPIVTSHGAGELLHPAVNPMTSTVLALYPSKSNPSRQHAVSRSHKTGDVWCTCPAWKFQRLPAGDRVCKHIRQLAGASLAGRGPIPRSAAGQELALAPKRDRLRRAAHAAHQAAKKGAK